MFPNISPNTTTSLLNAAFRVLSRLSDAMCSDSKLSRLCRLDDDFLRPYTESGVVLVAQESEVLVTLPQVLRQVKLWTLKMGSNWEGFIRLLCVCMNLAITVAVSCSSSCSVDGADDLHSGSSRLILVLKPKLENADWSITAGVVWVLCDIRKYLKSEDDDELVEPDAQKGSRADALFQRSLFLGNLIQFLRSMVEQSGSAKASGGSTDKHHPVFSTFITLVPQLLCWCLDAYDQAHFPNLPSAVGSCFMVATCP
ncbi:uncharacterized protein [Malus domestica]|uniref:uncharacterized protein isoform X6 n=1 Tax=Malus domestica TaxID=3750 RepID=UPI00397602D3